MDEPLSNLDAKLRAEMRLELLKLQRDLGLTTIYVSHDQEALAMSTRIAVMKDCQIMQRRKPHEIYEQPAGDFVAVFVGKTNIFPGRVTRCNGQYVEVNAEDGFVVRANLGSSPIAPETGEAVILAIRPEAIDLRDLGTMTGRTNRIAGQIAASAYQGSFVECELLSLGEIVRAHVANPKGKLCFRAEQVSILLRSRKRNLMEGNFGV